MAGAATMGPGALILASGSAARAAMLRAAGLDPVIAPARVDEAALKSALLAEGADPRRIADALAEVKAIRVSARHPGALVIGADQVLSLDGRIFDKPADPAEAMAHLASLSGQTHRLLAAVVLARDGQALWRHVGEARLTMRDLDAAAIARYVDRAGPAILECVGAYQIEGLGAQLFTAITGDQFTIMGLPLLPLLGILRDFGHEP